MKTENKNFEKYKYALIVGVSTLIGALVLLFLVISPLYSKVTTTGDELDQAKQELTALENKKSKLDELKDRESELVAEAAKVSDALPTAEEVGRLFIQLDALATTSGGVLESVDKVTATTAIDSTDLTASGITTSSYDLKLTFPSYYNLKNFISSSESALRLVSIDSFDISADETGILQVNLTINSYTRS